MPDPLPPSPLPPRPSRPDPTDVPDPEFWGPPRPSRGRGRGGGLSRPGAAHGLTDRLVERVRWWRADPRAGAAVLVVVALVAGVAWYRIGMASAGDGADGSAAAPAPASASAATSTPEPDGAAGPGPTESDERDTAVTVHVAGAVARPGVVELPGGARVIDAVEAAGGGLPEADLDRLNLAARLVDGQQVLVQRLGDPPLPAGGAGGPPAEPGDPTSELINLNTATTAQLETLPGIGPTLAEAIVDERERRGGYRSVNELRDVRGIGDKRFADIEGLVTV